LAIVHEFVTLHGGTVSIEDAPEGGALFRVTMPRQAPIGADVRASTSNLVAIAETDRPTIEPHDDGGETATPEVPDERRPLILIVEDNRDMNRFIADSLRSEYRIATAFDGREGLRKAKELRPDLVLTDFMLPEMSGDEMVYALREERSFDSTPVIFLTAKADDAVRINLLRTGAQDYVLKPFSIKELRARIANLVGKKITDERNHVLIDQLQQRQAELDRVAIQLAAANRDLEAFSFSIAHDLHAPLRAIAGFCEVIQSDHAAKLDATAAELLSRVVRNVRRMDEMIDGLLELSKLSRAPLNHAPIKLNELAESIVTELRDSTPQRHVDFVIKPELLAEGDPRLVRILLTNLIGNAWKYTGKQSHARIEVGKTGTNGRNAFYVRDNGVGFDMAHAINLFGVFQRLHRADEFEGNGIGLATAQRIVQRHGGELWVEAETGKGATFYFTLAASPKQ
jgi:signal transduction histidine kinase